MGLKMLTEVSEIPNKIRDLRSSDKAVREQALEQLFDLLVHQGSRYRWSAAAVPKLAKLLDDDAVVDKDGIIELLVSIAIGYDDEYLPTGLNAGAFRQKLIHSGAKLSKAGKRIPWRLREHYPSIVLACYNAVEKEVLRFVNCLNDTNKFVRMAASYALAWFPDEAAVSIPRLQSLLKTELEPLPITTSLISLGFLVRNSSNAFDLEKLTPYLRADSALIRASAAIALTINQYTPQQEIVACLIDATVPGEHLLNCSKIPFDEGRFCEFVVLTLGKGNQEMKDLAIDALCEKYERGELLSYEPLCTVRSILDLLMSRGSVALTKQDLQSLTPVQTRALRVFADFGRHKPLDYTQLSNQYGLPISQHDLELYLSDR